MCIFFQLILNLLGNELKLALLVHINRNTCRLFVGMAYDKASVESGYLPLITFDMESAWTSNTLQEAFAVTRLLANATKVQGTGKFLFSNFQTFGVVSFATGAL